jgi:predicted DNA-binding transcriptional regulator YafY
LSGYDYHAQSDRIFKADQIVNCAIGGQANLGQANSPQKEETVELIVDLKAVNFIERNSTIIIGQKMRNGQLHVKLKVSNIDWLKRAILSNAPSIKVISPQSLASEVEQMASDLISAYSGLS